VPSRRERPGSDDLPDEVAFLTKPYLPATVISLIRQMATPQIVERAPTWREANRRRVSAVLTPPSGEVAVAP
jgi:hypothetical protein